MRITDRDNASLLAIGCYRSDEVEEGHAVIETLLRPLSVHPEVSATEITLQDPPLNDVNDLLRDLLDTGTHDEGLTMGSARILKTKTFSNPFF